MTPSRASTADALDPKSITGLGEIRQDESEAICNRSAWPFPRKRSISDLVNDWDALADWRRNLARLRAEMKE